MEQTAVMGDFPVRLWIEAGATSLTLRVAAVAFPERSYAVRVTALGEPSIAADDPDSRWGLWRGLPRGYWRDPFWIATRRAHEWLFSDAPPRPEAGFRTRCMREVYAMCRSAAVRAADLCDPGARAIAMKFLPHARWYVYRAVVRDRSGRVAQLAQCCPGAVMFAYALHEHGVDAGDGPADQSLLADAVAGRSLRRVLDRAVDAWLFALETRCALPRPHDLVWAGIRGGAVDVAEAARLQRLLVRRACTRVPTTVLWLPPPAGIAPDDMPRGVRPRASWYRAVKAAAVLGALRELTPGDQARLASFASVHGATLHERGRRRRSSVTALLGQILDAFLPDRAVPCRGSSLERVLAETAAWHRQQADTCDGLHDDTPLPITALPSWRDDDFEAHAIGSIAELVREGRAMRNCVASRLSEALTGNAVYYHAVHGRERATLEVSYAGDAWTLTEAAGFANAELTGHTLIAAARLVAAINRAERLARNATNQLSLPL